MQYYLKLETCVRQQSISLAESFPIVLFHHNNLSAILAHASASAKAWWWFVMGQPQASATVCSWWLGSRRPKWRREARQVQRN